MILTPQIQPISELARDHKTLLRKLKSGPVFLAQRGRPAAVVVSPQQWDSIATELSRLRRIVEGDRQFAEIRAGNYVGFDDLDQALEAMNARSS
jgi:PHD/YefM family antitoxin component YafN of YafNO toxin-antitoxin module